MGDGEGEGGKAMATVTRVAGERTAMATKWAMSCLLSSAILFLLN
jgi:hypothetical protein